MSSTPESLMALSLSLPTDNRVGSIVVSNAVCQGLATLFFLARLYSRAYLLRTWRLDDWVLLFAWIMCSGTSIATYFSVHYGLGSHVWMIKMENVTRLQLTTYISQVLFIIALPLTKLSICLSYRRVFATSERDRSRYLVDIIVGLLVLTAVPLIFITIFQCHPISAYWSGSPDRSMCLDLIPVFYVNGVSNMVTDAALILLLFPQILSLRMAHRQKIALLIVVSMGWFAVASGIARMVRSVHFLNSHGDATYDFADVNIWTAIEVHISLICAAAPCIRPFIVQLMPRLLGTTISGTTTKGTFSTAPRASLPNTIAPPGARRSLRPGHMSVSTITLELADPENPNEAGQAITEENASLEDYSCPAIHSQWVDAEKGLSNREP